MHGFSESPPMIAYKKQIAFCSRHIWIGSDITVAFCSNKKVPYPQKNWTFLQRLHLFTGCAMFSFSHSILQVAGLGQFPPRLSQPMSTNHASPSYGGIFGKYLKCACPFGMMQKHGSIWRYDTSRSALGSSLVFSGSIVAVQVSLETSQEDWKDRQQAKAQNISSQLPSKTHPWQGLEGK